ncbi:MAG: hypothetical protein JWQ27_554 [Ferruginibacter sp.]|nr:hypothetical protein [Ferruginibacter sp.]
MKKLLILCGFLSCCITGAMASHITGGEMYYTYSGNHQYAFTLKLFMRCNSGRSFNSPAIISIFDKGTGARVSDINVPLADPVRISITTPDKCISNPPFVCYDIGYYFFTLNLPQTASGYIVASEVNFRIAGISNLADGSSQVGATYTAEVPGTAALSGAPANNSAHFIGSDLVTVCANNFFSYSFGAEDRDGDQLKYYFCEAYRSTNTSSGTAAAPLSPPYPPVPYGNGFSATSPLGLPVHIDPNTGLITGVAPPEGIYVVTVCVQEIRNGIVIATQRKDLQIYITGCNIAAATLQPEYQLCRETYFISLSNLSSNPLINFYQWEIRNSSGLLIVSSANEVLNYNFADTGTYTVKLKIGTGEGCLDSTTSLIRVYPGFRPAFTSTGICFGKPTIFHDETTSVFGTPNSWSWSFGEINTSAGSIVRHPTYTYPSLGDKFVVMTVTNTVGCKDTVSKVVGIIEKPPITLGFRDSLICVNDQVQLLASGTGNFTWTPVINMQNPNSGTPVVRPLLTTTYQVVLETDGCINKDSVRVRVVDHVTLSAIPDTTICKADPITLRIVSDGFIYQWTPAASLSDPSAKTPIATATDTTIYKVRAVIGGCFADAQIKVNPVPYPKANAGKDTIICFNSAAQLNGSGDGNRYQWRPAGFLSNPNILNPVAKPPFTSNYVLFSFDNKGCPKPGLDTVLVAVLPKIIPYAGNDTAVVVGQPLQLNATGGIRYEWSPAGGLSDPEIANPTITFYESTDMIRYMVKVYNEAGCVDSAFFKVKIFSTGPTIFVPSGFTPNTDGLNDVLRPIAVGMKQLNYFSVYNRNGQLMFNTTEFGKGWNGKYGGQPQDAGTFVWMVKAIDYLGKPYIQKGSVILIR